MQCTKPLLIKNPKQGAVPSPRFQTGFKVPCGKCLACRISKTREWSIRLVHEASTSLNCCFITLTYNDECLPNIDSLNKNALQNFIKRFRYYHDDVSIKYYACGEYGDESGRPHYHLLLFGWRPEWKDLRYTHSEKGRPIYKSLELCQIWQYGFNSVDVGITYDSAAYVAGYVRKKLNGDKAKDVYGDKQPPFALQSQGIGKQYCMENADQLRSQKVVMMHNATHSLPRYYCKLLNIDSEELSMYAIRNELEIETHWLNRGIPENEIPIAIAESRETYNKSLVRKYENHFKGRL